MISKDDALAVQQRLQKIEALLGDSYVELLELSVLASTVANGEPRTEEVDRVLHSIAQITFNVAQNELFAQGIHREMTKLQKYLVDGETKEALRSGGGNKPDED